VESTQARTGEQVCGTPSDQLSLTTQLHFEWLQGMAAAARGAEHPDSLDALQATTRKAVPDS